MKNKKKIIMAVLSICLVIAIGVGSTYAYYKKNTDTLTNTFTFVGPDGIDATLTEPSFVPADALNLTPGTVVPKDPTVTNNGSIDEWVALKADITKGDGSAFTPTELATVLSAITINWNSDGASPVWTRYNSTTAADASQYFFYNTVLTSADPDEKTTPLFTSVTINSTATDAAMTLLAGSGINIVVKGSAIDSVLTTAMTDTIATANFTFAA